MSGSIWTPGPNSGNPAVITDSYQLSGSKTGVMVSGMIGTFQITSGGLLSGAIGPPGGGTYPRLVLPTEKKLALDGVPEFLRGAPATIIADWLEENGRPNAAAFVRDNDVRMD